jgi:hypothetical protein
MPPNDFVALILTHGRPDHVHTYPTIRKAGYTGPVIFVLDDQDETAPYYEENFGPENIRYFSKTEIASRFPPADNFGWWNQIWFARNAAFDIASDLGYRYHIQLDDDYVSFNYRHNELLQPSNKRINNLDDLLSAMLDFIQSTPTHSIALAQGGDFIGSAPPRPYLKRKCMNSWICDGQRRFPFLSGINEDVSTYVTLGSRGFLFFTFMSPQLTQIQTQQNEGGMTDLYETSGTYVKSFYTVMYSPSCTKVDTLTDYAGTLANPRIHHRISWNHAVPKIIASSHKKNLSEIPEPKLSPSNSR